MDIVEKTQPRSGRVRNRLSALILLVCLLAIAAHAQNRQSMPTIPIGVELVTPANYGFGVAIGPDGTVFWSENNKRRIMRRTPSGQVSVVTQDLAGSPYGLACDSNGNLFIGIDSTDPNSNGYIIRFTPTGQKTTIVTGLQRPRQLATDNAGDLYFVLEGGSVEEWLAATGTVTLIASGLPTPQGVVVGSDGSIYIDTYMSQNSIGQPTAYGNVYVIRPGQQITVLATGFYRGRGMAELDGSLYLCTESNYYDNGNSGLIIQINETTGATTNVVTGLDYPEFAAAGNGKFYTTLGRDDWLITYDPVTAANYSNNTWPNASPTINYGAENGAWTDNGNGNLAFNTNGLILPGTRGDTAPVTGWIRIPASYFNISTQDLSPCSGTFHLPQTLYKTPDGTCFIAVLPLRQQTGTRWPQNGGCSDNPGFSEAPIAYLVYFSWIPGDWANTLIAPSYNSDHMAIMNGGSISWSYEGPWAYADQTWLQSGMYNTNPSSGAYADLSLGAFSGTKKYIYIMWHKNGPYRPHSAQYVLTNYIGTSSYTMTINEQLSADGLNHPDDTFSGWKLFGNQAYYIRPDTYLQISENNAGAQEYLQADAVMISDYPIVSANAPGAVTNFLGYPALSVQDYGPTGIGNHWGLEGLGYLYGARGETGYSITQALDQTIFADAPAGPYYIDVSWDYVGADNIQVPNAQYAVNGAMTGNIINQNRSAANQGGPFVEGNSRGTWSGWLQLDILGNYQPGTQDIDASLSYQGSFTQNLVADMVRFVPVNPSW